MRKCVTRKYIYILIKTKNMNNFIHFGCWNNLNKGCLVKVTNLLKDRLKDIDKQKIDFLTIAGDNYYPKKEVDGKKKKIIIPGLLEKGFGYLPTEIPIYMVLGNHDLETNTGGNNFVIEEKVFEPPVEEKKNDCSIIKYEQISKNINGNIEYNLFKEFMLENGTLIIMIDTSMYSVDADKYLPCYKYFLQSILSEYTVEKLREYQQGLIINTIKKYKDVNNLILIGHHPIIGLKNKSGEDTRINDIIEFDNVLKEIYSILMDNVNYYYLCADVHLYQEGNIVIKIDDTQTMNINQYIVGTGGTDLDNCPIKSPSEIKIDDDDRLITYTITRCEKKCGFLECITTDSGLEMLFSGVQLKGGKRISKRKTRKNKKSKGKTRKSIRR